MIARVGTGGVERLDRDPSDPMSLGFLCEEGQRSVERLTSPTRILTARIGPRTATATEAIAEAGRLVSRARKGGGARVGLYLGRRAARDQLGLLRSLAFGVAVGTPQIFSEVYAGAEARLQVTERMLGVPTLLLADVARAQVVVLTAGDREATDWGPLHRGMRYGADLEASAKSKKLKLFVVDSRAPAGPVAGHLGILPGRESFFFLGLLSALVASDLVEAQYVRDHTTGFQALRAALEPWPVDRCASACDVETSALAGLALKLARAPTAVIHPGWSAFQGRAPLVGAWAWLAIHAVTGHLLRPGGLYDHKGVVDLGQTMPRIPSKDAPRNAAGRPLLLLQSPASDLRAAIEARAIDVLVTVEGDPLTSVGLGGSGFGGVPVVALDTHETRTTAEASVVVPVADTWERFDQQLVDASLLPVHGLSRATPVAEAPAGVAPSEAVLRALFQATQVGIRGSSFGIHFGVGARLAVQADFASWRLRLGELSPRHDVSALEQPPHRVIFGEADRATWRVLGDRVDLFPDAVRDALRSCESPQPDPAFPLVLRTSIRPDRSEPGWDSRDPGAAMHPDTGPRDGVAVVVETQHGSVATVARHDPRMRAGVVDLPWGYGVDVHPLYGNDAIDSLTGAIVRDGHACRLRT